MHAFKCVFAFLNLQPQKPKKNPHEHTTRMYIPYTHSTHHKYKTNICRRVPKAWLLQAPYQLRPFPTHLGQKVRTRQTQTQLLRSTRPRQRSSDLLRPLKQAPRLASRQPPIPYLPRCVPHPPRCRYCLMLRAGTCLPAGIRAMLFCE
jgi:hypothetical protein